MPGHERIRASGLNSAIALSLNGADERERCHQERPGDVTEFPDGTFFAAVSPAMRKLREDLDRVARIDVPMIFVGEAGTGKEATARLLHRLSMGATESFVKVNCAAAHGEVLPRELLGPGTSRRTQALSRASAPNENGTHFLDEITDMPPAGQAKLLNLMQRCKFGRLDNGRRAMRVIAATSANLQEEVAAKRLREDLYYRLGVFVFQSPPLRERKEDILILLRRYIAWHARSLCLNIRDIPEDVKRWCLGYHWPGNISELENFAKRYLLFGPESRQLAIGESSAKVLETNALISKDIAILNNHCGVSRQETDADIIVVALKRMNWNRKATAELLNIGYKSLLSKIQQYRLDQQRSGFRPDNLS